MPFLLALLCLFPGSKLFAQTYHLHIGESIRLSLPGKVKIDSKNYVSLKDLGSMLELTGRKKGLTTLISGRKLISIYTLSTLQTKTYALLRARTPATLGLNTELKNGRVLLSGILHRFEDWQKISELCRSDDCDYDAAFVPSTSAQADIAQELAKFITDHNQPNYAVQWQTPFSITSSMKDAKDPAFVNLYRSLGIRVQKNENTVELAPLVRVKITVAEIKRNHTQNLGISWPGQMKAQLLPQFLWKSESTEAALNLLEQQGVSKTLANPSLLCRSGKSAEFIAGGEIPIKIMNYKMQDIVWKRYGILLKMKPKADYQGRMSIELETEVSSLDAANKVDGIPGVFTNRMQSHFDLKSSRTIVLSGLIKSEDSQSTEGLPGLSRLPILGKLFGSEDFRNNKTELLIFVTPEVIDDNAE